MFTTFHRFPALRHSVAAALLSLASIGASAQATASEASALSTLPVAISVAAPVMIISGGALLTVAAVQATSTGAVWVLERASDGARATVQLSGRAAGGLSNAVGTTVVVAAISTGWVLSAASQAIAFIPNEVGAALLYNEQVTR